MRMHMGNILLGNCSIMGRVVKYGDGTFTNKNYYLGRAFNPFAGYDDDSMYLGVI